MKESLEFIFSGIWTFVGFALLLGGFANFILIIWQKFLKFLILRKHGYPPVHCDADGDQLVEEENS